LKQQASPLLIEKRKLLKKTPLEILRKVGAHQKEENEVDVNLPGRKGFED